MTRSVGTFRLSPGLGDTHQIVFSLSHANGTTPSVTTAPLVTVINLTTGAAVVTAAAMTLVAWNLPRLPYGNTAGMLNGDYLAVVSYAADGRPSTGSTSIRSRGRHNIRADSPQRYRGAKCHRGQDWDRGSSHGIGDDPSQHLVCHSCHPGQDGQLAGYPRRPVHVTALVQFITDIHDTVRVPGLSTRPRIRKSCRFCGLTEQFATFTVTEDDNSAARTMSA